MQVCKGRPLLKRAGGILAVAAILAACAVQPAAESGRREKPFLPPDTTAAEIGSNRHTQAESGAAVANSLTTDGYEKTLANGRLEVWFRHATASIRVVDTRSGYVWGALAADSDSDLNDRWTTMAHSLLTLEYFDESRNLKTLGLSDDSVFPEYTWAGSALHAQVTALEAGIAFSFTMTLEADSLVFSLDEGSLQETGANTVKSLYFAPFLGCTRADAIDGYLFVPDGPGALIRFAKEARYVKPYEARIYGPDTGVDTLVQSGDLKTTRTNDYRTDEQQASVPVYGIVHGAGQHALMGVAESGAEYAAILAYPAGVVTPYNWATIRFDYRTLYTEPTSQDGSGIEQVQREANPVTPRLRLTFLSGEEADYSGMAAAYRRRLEQAGALGSERLDAQIPLQLDVMGADVKKGFLFKGLSVLTTAGQAQEMVAALQEDGITNLTLTFDGWRAGGLHGGAYDGLSFERRLGGRAAFLALRDAVTGQGGRFYLKLDPVTANKDQISLLQAPAISLSGRQQKRTRLNSRILYNEAYFLKPSLTAALVSRSLDTLDGFNLAFDKLGSSLYADYTRSRTVTRSQALAALTGLWDKGSAARVALSMPNAYLWGQTGEITDLPVTNSQYTYETDTVPFLPMVLKGHVDYYAPHANQGFYATYSILKMIEYGAYPSFIVAYADNLALHNTPVEDYFSIHFDDWRGTIGQVYGQVNAALAPVEGAHILRHTVIRPGIVQVVYDNGVTIYINYTNAAYTDGTLQVAAQGYTVKGADR